jgi:hypothetical protein
MYETQQLILGIGYAISWMMEPYFKLFPPSFYQGASGGWIQTLKLGFKSRLFDIM